jgi:hypothetical protein
MSPTVVTIVCAVELGGHPRVLADTAVIRHSLRPYATLLYGYTCQRIGRSTAEDLVADTLAGTVTTSSTGGDPSPAGTAGVRPRRVHRSVHRRGHPSAQQGRHRRPGSQLSAGDCTSGPINPGDVDDMRPGQKAMIGGRAAATASPSGPRTTPEVAGCC